MEPCLGHTGPSFRHCIFACSLWSFPLDPWLADYLADPEVVTAGITAETLAKQTGLEYLTVFTSNIFAILGLRAMFFHAGRCDGQIPIPEIRARHRAHLCRPQNGLPEPGL